MKVIKVIKWKWIDEESYTHHGSRRNYRREIMDKKGRRIISFLVDRNHRNGLEVHTIFESGLIYVQNHQSEKICTILVARYGQVHRYYKALNLVCKEKKLLANCIENEARKINI